MLARHFLWSLLLVCGTALLLPGCLEEIGSPRQPILEPTCEDKLPWIGTSELCPVWSPTGDRVAAFVGYDPNGDFASGFYVIDIRTRAWKKVVETGAFRTPDHVDWNRRADHVLVSYDPSADVIDLVNGTATTLTDTDGEPIFGARWSPEGDSIWYARTGGTYVMSAAGGAPRLFMPTGGIFRAIGGWEFSPDGRTIAYAHGFLGGRGFYDQNNEIMIIGRDGQGARQLTFLGGLARNPSWIHGGREILFDWVDSTCVHTLPLPERTWLAVDVQTGRIRRLGQYLGSAKYQASFPIGVDARGEYAAVVGEGSFRGTATKIGVLYLTPIERPLLTRLFRPGSPQAP